MNSVFAFAQSPADHFLVNVALRATAILAFACCAAIVVSLCRRSAAARHVIWHVAVVGVLFLPLITALVPSVEVAAPWPQAAAAEATFADTASLAEPAAGLFAGTFDSPEAATAAIDGEPESATHDEPGAQLVATAASDSQESRPVPWLFTTWAVGCALALLPALLGFASLWKLERRCQSVAGDRLHAACARLASRFGLWRPVRLLLTDERSMPMAFGIWQPRIVLPAAAESWSEDRLQMVLRHELAHIQRGDCLTQILAELVRAMYWFHPLAWIAHRQLRTLQELACDDLVLCTGVAGPDYAEQLLSVAANSTPAPAPAVALAMAREHKLKRRLLAILAANQSRRPVSRRSYAIALAMAGLVVTLGAAIELRSNVAPAQQLAQQPAQRAAKAGTEPVSVSDSAKTLADLRAKIAAQYVSPVNDQDIVTGAIKGMVEALRDPYSDYLPPDTLADLNRDTSGSLVGIGVQLELHEKQVRVVTPLAGSPAHKAGVQPGDLILAIDDQPTEGLELRDVVKRIAGAAGTPVSLKVKSAAGQDANLKVVRGSIPLPTVKGYRRGPDHAWNYVADADRNIGYLQIVQFGATTPRDAREAIESLKQSGVKGLILDLRFCPGGLLDSATAFVKLLVNEGTIVSLHGRGQESVKIAADSSAILPDVPLVVLVNGQTASAAEVVAGALQDSKRALVLGTRTHGKGNVQTLIKLEEIGGALKLTTSEYRLPSGRSIDKRPGQATWGVNPDDGYFVPLDRSQVKALQTRQRERDIIGPAKQAAEGDTDPQLAAALKTLAARIEKGAFEKVATTSQREIENWLKRDEIEQRRESTLATLQQLDRDLAALK